MSVNYKKLWILLIEKGLKKTDLIVECGVSSNVVARLGKNEYVSLETLEKICSSLDCQIEDVIEFK